MRLSILLFSVLFTVSVLAQKQYTISNKTPFSWAPLAEGEVNIHTSLINNATNPGDTTFRVVFLDKNTPSAWLLGLCSDVNCYSPGAGFDEAIYVQVGKPVDFKCTFNYNSPPVPGNGTARFSVFRSGMSSQADTIVFSTIAPAAGISNAPKSISASISPNPVKNELVLTLSDYNITSLSIINLVGKEVMTLDIKAGKSFDVSTLPNGIYFLRVAKGESTYNKKFVISK